jgi:hypothetical protein
MLDYLIRDCEAMLSNIASKDTKEFREGISEAKKVLTDSEKAEDFDEAYKKLLSIKANIEKKKGETTGASSS